MELGIVRPTETISFPFFNREPDVKLSESMPVEDFFRSLNEFFDCTAGAVLEHGGEILSYIGDAVFAIFTIGGTERPLREACFREEGACAAALAAARDARARVDALTWRISAGRTRRWPNSITAARYWPASWA